MMMVIATLLISYPDLCMTFNHTMTRCAGASSIYQEGHAAVDKIAMLLTIPTIEIKEFDFGDTTITRIHLA